MAASTAAVGAFPALWLPFLSDDWATLAAVDRHELLRTPFGYFRPLYLATYWLDRAVWGLNPHLFHLTNLLLLAAAAGLAVIVVRRHSGNSQLAALTGVLFAVHPYHFHNAAWIAARADSLCAMLLLGAAFAHHRWNERPTGIPFTTIMLFEGSLLAKEAGAAFPIVLTALALSRQSRPTSAEWLRGYLPLYAVALVHFLVLRPLVLGELGLSRIGGADFTWVMKLLGFCAGALLPLPIDVLERSPMAWGGLAITLLVLLTMCFRRGLKASFGLLLLSSVLFVLLLIPSLIAFQERYFVLPSLASALAVSALICSGGAALRRLASLCVLALWLAALGWQWSAWRQAGMASASLVEGLVEASHRPDVQQVVLSNLPYRVGGAPVVGDFESAITLMGGRPVSLCAATSIDYPWADVPTLDGEKASAVKVTQHFAEVKLRVGSGIYTRLDDPKLGPGNSAVSSDCADVESLQGGTVVVRIRKGTDGRRRAYLWDGGDLEPLF